MGQGEEGHENVNAFSIGSGFWCQGKYSWTA